MGLVMGRIRDWNDVRFDPVFAEKETQALVEWELENSRKTKEKNLIYNSMVTGPTDAVVGRCDKMQDHGFMLNLYAALVLEKKGSLERVSPYHHHDRTAVDTWWTRVGEEKGNPDFDIRKVEF
eukprot:TRINITY_DN9452_c0_g1_i1.p1 TRINITY_DN9452_c0_g1~~TRINITY_DN9452_c0_g1_i1.p1  ORF type:complete len:123 (-),score=31.30 TRINITY_DN9452_c0_g1_i1:37-405(-)